MQYNIVYDLIQDGSTALFMAADSGYADICKLLVEHGASVNTTEDVRL